EYLAKELGNKCETFQTDLSNEEAVSTLFASVISRFGHLDVLVNNAGTSIYSPMEENDKSWLSSWHKTMAVNLTAASILCRSAIGHFIKRGGGRIINISSRAAFRGDSPEYLAYAASKGGLVAITRSIARGYGKMGIKAFDVAPGFTKTDMANQFIEKYGEEHALKDIALNELTSPDDIAPLVVLLSSGLADHATGTTIDINAGSYV